MSFPYGAVHPARGECSRAVADVQKDVCCLQGQVGMLLLSSFQLLGLNKSERNL